MSRVKLPNFGSKKHPARRKGFVIDKISEDSFYENLLLGAPAVLRACPFVSQVRLDRLPPATVEQLLRWESAHQVRLPEDLRAFYLSTDGFRFSYAFQLDREDAEVAGGLAVNPLARLEAFRSQETWCMTERGGKVAVPPSRAFALADLEEGSRVVLAAFAPLRPLSLWLHHKGKTFFYLCEDLSTYLRMGLAHLGVPGWQQAVLKASLSEWSAEMLRILAPGVLQTAQREGLGEVNRVDAGIFSEEAVVVERVERRKRGKCKARRK